LTAEKEKALSYSAGMREGEAEMSRSPRRTSSLAADVQAARNLTCAKRITFYFQYLTSIFRKQIAAIQST
jgi:hypothetical protein